MVSSTQVKGSLQALQTAYELGVEDTLAKVTEALQSAVCDQCKDTPMGATMQLSCREALGLIAYLTERITK